MRIFLADMNLTEIQLPDLERFAARWLNQTRAASSPKTTHRRLTSLRAFAVWSGEPRLLATYSLPTPAKPVPHPLRGLMADVRKLVAAAKHDHQRALYALCGMCGLRISEARSVTPESFDLDRSILVVRGKGDRERKIPLSLDTLIALLPRLARTPPYMPLVPVNDRAARAYITRHGSRVLGYDIASHDLRMTFGTVVNDKYGLRAAQELLGHATSKSTEGYTLVTLDALRRAVEF